MSAKKLVARYMLLVLVFPVLVLAATYKAHTYYGLPVGTLMRDPSAVANVPWYVGIVSNLGVLMWCATAAVCAFAAVVLFYTRARARAVAFMACAAAMSLLLMFDDLFMLHEAVLPQTFSVGEKVFLMIDAGLLGLFMLAFARDILARDWPILGGAFVMFGLSVGLDRVRFESLTAVMDLCEDGGKFLGAALWLGFFARTAMQMVCRLDRGADAGVYSPASNKEPAAHGHTSVPSTHTGAGA